MTGTASTTGRGGVVSPELAVERADAFLRAHAGTPVSISQLCRVVGISERGLRNAFHRLRGTSPKRYILAERLRAVQGALSAAEPRRGTVTEVATLYGFSELGRFAGVYKKVYGETPSDTLRARRRPGDGSN